MSAVSATPAEIEIVVSLPSTAKARTALAAAVMAISWAAILIRVAPAPPLAIAFWRLALATALLTAPAWWLRRRGQGTGSGSLVVVAGLLLAVHFGLWIGSLFLTSVASSVLLVSTQPIFAGLVTGPLLGERPGARTWTAILLAVSGSAVIAAGDAGLEAALLGDAMALGAAAAAAVYLVLGRRARLGGPLPIYLWRVNGVAAMALLGACLVTSTPLVGFPPSAWAAFLALAAGPHLAGHGLLNLAVRALPAPTVNLALAGEPILSTSYAAALLGERPSSAFYAGAALVLAGLLVEFGKRRREALR